MRSSRYNFADWRVVSSGVVRCDLVGYAAQWVDVTRCNFVILIYKFDFNLE
jgi:hypothetical protein